MTKLDKKKIIEIVVAVLVCLVIVAIPLTVMLTSNDINTDNNDSNIDGNVPPNGDTDGGITDSNTNENIDKPNENNGDETTNPDAGKPDGDALPDGKIRVNIEISAKDLFKVGNEKYLQDVQKRLGDKLFLALNDGDIYSNAIILDEGAKLVDLMRLIDSVPISMIETSMGAYIQSMAGLSEKMAGTMSGWVYTANAKPIMMGISDYVLTNNVSISWNYIVGDRSSI